MAATYGTADDVRRIANFTSEELTDAEVESFLNEAARKIQGDHGEAIVETFNIWVERRSNDVHLTYDLRWTPRSGSTPEIYLQGDQLTSPTEYSISGRTITLTSDAEAEDRMVLAAKYTPDLYDDYANAVAALRIVTRQGVLSQGSEGRSSTIDEIKEMVDSYRRSIANRATFGTFTDHAEEAGIY